MLTLRWSDGNTFIPAAFSLLSSAKESNVFQPVQDGIDKRTTAYKRRKLPASQATAVIFDLLDAAKGLPSKYVLFDSWYGLPVTSYGIWKKGCHVIYMVKDSSKIHFFYDICDEVKDIRFAEALILILDLLARTLAAYPAISEEMATVIINTVFNDLPAVWKQKLQLSA